MKRFLITIEYLGEGYKGFQAQKDPSIKTVEGEVNKALFEIFKKETKIVASGRLDSGVNALDLKAHFDTDSKVPASKYLRGINRFLPRDIRVVKVEEVKVDFHARYSVKQKTYRYVMYLSEVEHPHLERDYKRLHEKPDLELMREGAKHLIGTHDFSAFMSKKSSVKTTIREVKTLTIKKRGNLIIIDITGNGFLYNMVRIIIGTLLDVGYERNKPEKVLEILKSCDRVNAGKLVEAKGLTLMNVEY